MASVSLISTVQSNILCADKSSANSEYRTVLSINFRFCSRFQNITHFLCVWCTPKISSSYSKDLCVFVCISRFINQRLESGAHFFNSTLPRTLFLFITCKLQRTFGYIFLFNVSNLFIYTRVWKPFNLFLRPSYFYFKCKLNRRRPGV